MNVCVGIKRLPSSLKVKLAFVSVASAALVSLSTKLILYAYYGGYTLEHQMGRTAFVSLLLVNALAASLIISVGIFVVIYILYRTYMTPLIEELKRKNEELLQMDTMKTEFVNAVSHELRTPLTSVIGYVEFLEDGLGGDLSEEQCNFIHKIDDGTKRLTRLVDDLLDFARLEAGTFKLNKEIIVLQDKIKKVTESFCLQAESSGITLEINLPKTPVCVEADKGRIGQVLMNLINNSLKFTPRGGAIAVSATIQDNQVMVEVADTGVGISEGDLVKLFKRYSQLEYGKHKGGTGLGLSISKQIVEAHGGTMGVRSSEGVGSTFWFTLPLKEYGSN